LSAEKDFQLIFFGQNIHFHPKPGTKLAPKKTATKTTGIFSWQMPFLNLILDISRTHRLYTYSGKQNKKQV
jgi:hypothetical protein